MAICGTRVHVVLTLKDNCSKTKKKKSIVILAQWSTGDMLNLRVG